MATSSAPLHAAHSHRSPARLPRLLCFVALLPHYISARMAASSALAVLLHLSYLGPAVAAGSVSHFSPDPVFTYPILFFVWQAMADSLPVIVTMVCATLITRPDPTPPALACTGILCKLENA